jgi:ATP-dependent DNA ligase
MTSTYQHVTDFKSLPGRLTDGHWEFPVVTVVGKRTAVWQVIVSATMGGRDVNIFPCLDNKPGQEHGRIDIKAYVLCKDKKTGAMVPGKVRDAVPTVVTSGKNKDKSVETNAVCQAMRDAYGQYLKKVKKSNAVAPPMLAQQYVLDTELPEKFHVQYKYDGLRMTTCVDPAGNLVLTSRNESTYTGLEYMREELRALCVAVGSCLDGELYVHGMSLQEISGIARKGRGKELNYVVYDIFGDLPYPERLAKLTAAAAGLTLHYVIIAPTLVMTSREELDVLFKKALSDGYEGLMIRMPAPYEHGYNGYHSKNLLKYKPCFDSEYTLTGWTTGSKGKAAQALMVICTARTPAGTDEEFNVTPAMELEERIALAKAMGVIEANGKTHFENQYRGRPLTVYYDDISDNGIPLRARTKMEFKDMA